MNGVTVGRLGRRSQEILGGFTTGQKAVVMLLVAAIGIGVMYLFQWAGTPQYAVLYSGVSATDAATITAKLTADHVPYQLSNGGSTILVPAPDVNAELVSVSGSGISTGQSNGYAILDKLGVTASEFMQNVDYQRAVESVLEQEINKMPGVTSSSVNLNIPLQSVFSTTSSAGSASVQVVTGPSSTLTSAQVQGIVHLVASGAPGIDPTQVVVVDGNGNMLAGPGMSASGTVLQAATAAAAVKQAQLQSYLDGIYGPNKVAVQVSADVNPNGQTSDTTTYGSSTPVASSVTKQTYTGPASGAAGVLGTTGVTTGTTGSTTGTSKYSNTSTTSNAVVGKTETQTVTAAGNVTRLSVAVAVDTSIPTAQLASIQNLVSSAAGLNPARGDVIKVQQVPFNPAVAAAAAKAQAQATSGGGLSTYISLGKTVLVLIVIIVFMLLAMRSASKASRNSGIPAAERLELEETRRALLSLQQGSGHLDSYDGAMGALTAGGGQAPAQLEVSHMAERQPDEVAALLRGWLEDRG